MYKVFFNDKSVVLTDVYDFDNITEGVLYFRYEDFEELHFVMNLLEESPKLNGVVVYHHDLPVLWADFRAHFREINVAGGLVSNKANELLLIYRNEKWDLPKGKLDDGETFEAAALREVLEECGAKDLTLGDHFQDTYHTYYIKGFRILKRTAWYGMQSAEFEFKPQAEENIEIVRWENVHDLKWSKSQTYPSIWLLIERYKELIGLP